MSDNRNLLARAVKNKWNQYASLLPCKAVVKALGSQVINSRALYYCGEHLIEIEDG